MNTRTKERIEQYRSVSRKLLVAVISREHL
jgi:hypothetical protein